MSQFSMIDVNRVTLAGRLTRDPEVRYTTNGTAVATLRLASDRKFKGRSGDTREETLFIDVVAWQRTAEICAQYLSKGRPVYVEGRLQSRNWETKDGQKRTSIEIVAERVQFMDYVADGGGGAGGAPPVLPDDGPPPPADDDIPF